jgi:hypothetical protein
MSEPVVVADSQFPTPPARHRVVTDHSSVYVHGREVGGYIRLLRLPREEHNYEKFSRCICLF